MPMCTLQGLPHARGGVSVDAHVQDVTTLSSPRPWGCFCRLRGHPAGVGVFPTPVGVFLRSIRALCVLRGLPHARGGVSIPEGREAMANQSSPRPWGCFYNIGQERLQQAVFPTPVGVFPPWTARDARSGGLPHARGGVSTLSGQIQGFDPSSPRPWGCFLSILL